MWGERSRSDIANSRCSETLEPNWVPITPSYRKRLTCMHSISGSWSTESFLVESCSALQCSHLYLSAPVRSSCVQNAVRQSRRVAGAVLSSPTSRRRALTTPPLRIRDNPQPTSSSPGWLCARCRCFLVGMDTGRMRKFSSVVDTRLHELHVTSLSSNPSKMSLIKLPTRLWGGRVSTGAVRSPSGDEALSTGSESEDVVTRRGMSNLISS
mmetsp:Transcript_3418/g.7335  ORF Transcript_3418/g.7335 Transcript_3418/m.7335 type:complete len:211 (+) Transcript_3418:814-1446(+)